MSKSAGEMSLKKTKLTPTAISIGSALTYLCSLVLPAFSTPDGGNFPGYFALLLGPIDLLALHLPWLANPLLALSWWQCSRGSAKRALALALASFATALVFLPGQNNVQIAMASSPSTYVASVGYYIWLASIAIQIFATTLLLLLQKRRAPSVA